MKKYMPIITVVIVVAIIVIIFLSMSSSKQMVVLKEDNMSQVPLEIVLGKYQEDGTVVYDWTQIYPSLRNA